jgi:hypothetical protein
VASYSNNLAEEASGNLLGSVPSNHSADTKEPDTMSKLQVIVGSGCRGRAADQISPWVIDRTGAHGGYHVEVRDLREWPLPIFAEHVR